MPEFDQQQRVNAAFSKQSFHFDEEDESNPIIQLWRQKIYNHVGQFLKSNSKILELNAGTGIDAMHFAAQGHQVHATDIADGMVSKIKEKASKFSLDKNISVQQISFDHLHKVNGKFDFVFSNFGGLNCISDLQSVTQYLPKLLNDHAIVTWVIMPKVTPWEWIWVFKSKFSDAFRRFKSDGVIAHLEGEYFKTYYHSLTQIKNAFGSNFKLIRVEGLGVVSPPPSAQRFVKTFPTVTKILNLADDFLRKKYPFNRWGDHLIVTFQFK